MAPIFVVVAIINILANINNYNIPDDPELKHIRVRRDNIARVHKQDVSVKSLLQGDHYRRRTKRGNYNTNYVSNVTPYSATHMWQYNPFNIPPKEQQQQQYVYNRQQPVYTQQQPVFPQQQPVFPQQQPVYTQQKPLNTQQQQQPVYNQQQPVMSNNNVYSYNSDKATRIEETVETTTPSIACILCNIECPTFMRRIGLFCESIDEEDEGYL